MASNQLYQFVKLKSRTIPIAIVRNSLIRHGYSRVDVDEAVRRVMLEEQESSREESKEQIFNRFGKAREERPHLLEPTNHESLEDKFVSLDELKKYKPVERERPIPLRRKPIKKVESGSVDSGFIDIEKLNEEAREKAKRNVDPIEEISRVFGVKAEEKSSVDDVFKERPIAKQPEKKAESAKEELSQPAYFVSDTDSDIEEPVKIELKDEKATPVKVKRDKSQVKSVVGLFTRIKASYDSVLRSVLEIDPIKLSYFILAVLSIVGIAVSLIFYRSRVYMHTIRFIMGASVVLLLAHNLRHMEHKYNIDANERNAFELSVTVGVVGWLLSLFLSPLYIIFLMLPGFFLFAWFVKDVYKTTMQIALKISAWTSLSAFFAFYAIAIVIGVLVGFRALI